MNVTQTRPCDFGRRAAVLATICLVLIPVAHGENVLFVGGAADPSAGDDFFVYEHLTDVLGHDVTYLSGPNSTPADGLAADLIVISSTLGSGDARGKFQNLGVPILNWEEAIMDGNTAAGNFAMGADSVNGQGTESSELEIVDPTHPLAAGLSGVIEIADIPIRQARLRGSVAPGVSVIARGVVTSGPIELVESGIGMHIGSTQTVANGFIGIMDEVAIWDRSLSYTVDANNNLTGGEVFAVYKQGVATPGAGTPGPIGYWPFNNTADQFTAVDESGNGFDALVDFGAEQLGGDTAPGVGGAGALVLSDGTGEVNAIDMERPGGELAYSFWFKPDSGTYGPTFDTADPRTDFIYGNVDPVRPHLSANRNGRPIGLYVRDGNGDINTTAIEAKTASFTSDEWHHLAITWDGDVGRVFVDGRLDNEIFLGESPEFPITAVDAGGLLTDGTLAPARVVNFPIENAGFGSLNENGLKLFDAAVAWLLGGGSTVPGDFDNDGELTVADVNLLSAEIAAKTNGAAFDLNADQLVNGDDLGVWVVDLKETWFGDADLNGLFNSNDFVTVFLAGLYEVNADTKWEEGDWNADLRFTSGDFVTAFLDGGYELGPRPAVAAVPEPSGIVLVLISLLALPLARRLA